MDIHTRKLTTEDTEEHSILQMLLSETLCYTVVKKSTGKAHILYSANH